MARITGPKCRQCRREGTKLYLKGARCETEKCGLTRRQTKPGQHGAKRTSITSFGLQLREKQKKTIWRKIETKPHKKWVYVSILRQKATMRQKTTLVYWDKNKQKMRQKNIGRQLRLIIPT